MRKLKVFLSKSKNGDYDLGLKTKDLLLKAGMEVVEYTGGTYSPDLMLSCDVLVMVPALLQQPNDTDYVGKGQFTELITWGKGKNRSSSIIVNNHSTYGVVLKKIMSLQLIEGEEDWKIKYGKIKKFSSYYHPNVISILAGVNSLATIVNPKEFFTDLKSALAEEFFFDIPANSPIKEIINPCKEVIGRGEYPDMSLNTTQPIARPLHLAIYKKLKR